MNATIPMTRSVTADPSGRRYWEILGSPCDRKIRSLWTCSTIASTSARIPTQIRAIPIRRGPAEIWLPPCCFARYWKNWAIEKPNVNSDTEVRVHDISDCSEENAVRTSAPRSRKSIGAFAASVFSLVMDDCVFSISLITIHPLSMPTQRKRFQLPPVKLPF